MIYDAEVTSKFPPALRFDFLHGTTSCSRSAALAVRAGLCMAPLFSAWCGALYAALWPFNADHADHDLSTVLACSATLLSWQDIIQQGKPSLDMSANTGLAADWLLQRLRQGLRRRVQDCVLAGVWQFMLWALRWPDTDEQTCVLRLEP